jgi:LysM repeat protein
MRWLLLSILFLFLAGNSTALAAEGQIYTIKKGDTLWDLSQRFIDDPYYWPNVWAKNPKITNPHLIFPGQKIRILDGRLEILPAYSEAEKNQAIPTAPPENVAAAEATGDSLILKANGSSHGFILTNQRPLGLLVDSVDNRALLTENDVVYVKMNDLATVDIGDRYSLYARGDLVEHPQTGEPLGTLMSNLGSLEVTEFHEKTVVARIDGAFREIRRGAELFTYIPPQQEITLQQGQANRDGFIVAARDEKSTVSANDIIFIDLGSRDGLAGGNLVYLTRPRQVSDAILSQESEIELPDAVLGAAVIIDVNSSTASALIIKSALEAHIGDQVSIVNE